MQWMQQETKAERVGMQRHHRPLLVGQQQRTGAGLGWEAIGAGRLAAAGAASELVCQGSCAWPHQVLQPHVDGQHKVPEACSQGGGRGVAAAAVLWQQWEGAPMQQQRTGEQDLLLLWHTDTASRLPPQLLPPLPKMPSHRHTPQASAPPTLPSSTRSRKASGFVLLLSDTSALGPSCRGEAPAAGLRAVTEQPMMRPWRRTPRYHCGPMRFSWMSVNPAAVNHWGQGGERAGAGGAGGGVRQMVVLQQHCTRLPTQCTHNRPASLTSQPCKHLSALFSLCPTKQTNTHTASQPATLHLTQMKKTGTSPTPSPLHP